jgi:nitrate reductase gamma subunit
MCEFIQGQLVSISVIIFVLGLIYQGIQFFRLTKKKEWVLPPLPQEEKPKKNAAIQSIVGGLTCLKGTLWKTDPLMTAVTSIFHVCLILVPIFLLGHNILLGQSWGIGLWSLPESLSDGLTIVLFICVLFFLMRRLFLTRVRAISTFYDYLILLIAIAPFLTGYLAYHQWFDYPPVMTLHILSGELMLITVPFTKLGHMLFFFLYRFLIGTEYSFVRGSRTW